MENPDDDIMLPQSQDVGLNREVSLEPEQEQQDESEPDTQPESNQGTPEPTNSPPSHTAIEFRIQQLQNRRFLLLKMQQFRTKAENSSGKTTEEITSEDIAEVSELEAIQKELEELLVKKEELEKHGKSSNLSKQDVHPPFSKPETPCGGIYMLPPFQENGPLGGGMPGEERAVVALESLGETPAVTKCPSCQEVVFTETRKRVGETMWLICCLCSMIGCVAGCCVIPFFVDRLRNVQHQCPHCQAQIRTHRPV